MNVDSIRFQDLVHQMDRLRCELEEMKRDRTSLLPWPNDWNAFCALAPEGCTIRFEFIDLPSKYIILKKQTIDTWLQIEKTSDGSQSNEVFLTMGEAILQVNKALYDQGTNVLVDLYSIFQK